MKQYNFKLLHRILPFKENLVRWKITSDLSCSHCKGFETSVHALLQCPEVSLFWQKVTHVISLFYDVNITVDERILLTGYDIQNKEMIIPNMILVFAQYTIYRVNMLCKFKPKQFNSFSLFSEFKQDLIVNLKFLEKRNHIMIKDNQFLEKLCENGRIWNFFKISSPERREREGEIEKRYTLNKVAKLIWSWFETTWMRNM